MGIGQGECAYGAAERKSTEPRSREEMKLWRRLLCKLAVDNFRSLDDAYELAVRRVRWSRVIIFTVNQSTVYWRRGGSAFVKASPRMCTAVGAYELAGVPYCIACTPGGSQDTCRSPGVLGGSVGAIRAVRSMPVASRAPRRLHARSSRHARFVTQPGRSAHRTLLCVH